MRDGLIWVILLVWVAVALALYSKDAHIPGEMAEPSVLDTGYVGLC